MQKVAADASTNPELQMLTHKSTRSVTIPGTELLTEIDALLAAIAVAPGVDGDDAASSFKERKPFAQL